MRCSHVTELRACFVDFFWAKPTSNTGVRVRSHDKHDSHPSEMVGSLRSYIAIINSDKQESIYINSSNTITLVITVIIVTELRACDRAVRRAGRAGPPRAAARGARGALIYIYIYIYIYTYIHTYIYREREKEFTHYIHNIYIYIYTHITIVYQIIQYHIIPHHLRL